MIDWIPVTGSTRIVAEAYDTKTETIYVRFPSGKEWRYSNCPPHVRGTVPDVAQALLRHGPSFHRGIDVVAAHGDIALGGHDHRVEQRPARHADEQ